MPLLSSKRTKINAELYNNIVAENALLWDVLSVMKNMFIFPIESLLEIGTGTGNFLTKYLVEKERAKQIDKYYAIEPVDEFFEESKRQVVRLSRTDATLHEYFGGNPFDVVTYSMVYNHIKPDKKLKLLKNIYNNLNSKNGMLVVLDMFVPDYKNQEERKKSIEEFLQAHLEYNKKKKNKFLTKYFTSVVKGEHEDYYVGEYKESVSEFLKNLKKIGFKKIKVHLHEGKESKVDWQTLGHYVITASK